MKKDYRFIKKLVLKISLPLVSLYFLHLQPLLRQLIKSIKLLFLKLLSPPPDEPEENREATILDYWQAIEYFSVQQIPEVTKLPKDITLPPPIEQVFAYCSPQPLPWEPNHWMYRSPRKNAYFLRFQVFGGVYPAHFIRQVLENKCGKEDCYEEDLGISEQLKEGDTCVYTFNTTDEGRPLFDSFILPTCAWALGRTLAPGPQDPAWFNDFPDFEMQVKQDFMKYFAIEDDDAVGQGLKQFNVGRIIQSADLIAYTQKIIVDLNLASIIKTPDLRLQSIYIRQKLKLPEKGRYENHTADFLNSFFIDDLRKISKTVEEQECGAGLKKFLSHKKDLQIEKRVDIRRNRQQLLNCLAPKNFPSGCWPTKGHHPLATSQQFAINAISDLACKAGILAVNGPPGTGKTTLLRDLISANIVERAKAVSRLKKPSDAFEGTDSWKVNDYLRTISLWKKEFKGFEIVVASTNNGAVENVSLEIPGQEAIDHSWRAKVDYFAELASLLLEQPAWALMAARLGNKSNCNTFHNTFWYGKQKEEKAQPGYQNFSSDLFGINSIQSGASFSERSYSAPARETSFKDILYSCTPQASDWRVALKQFNQALAQEKHKRAEAEKIYTLFHQAAQLQEKPEWLPSFLAEWRLVKRLLNYLKSQPAQRKLQILQDELSQQNQAISLVDWLEDENIRELSIPWLTPEWFQARSQVFIEALKLHKAFILANAPLMRQNLQGAMDILQGTVPRGTNTTALSAAWSTLFFVVPVISTTFASFSRLFSHIGQEGLGWLLIDEAGQALPQAAVGAIWRSKRIVVVGDPMQLKPVITLSLSAQFKLQQHFNTEITWVPGLTSVQELADRICSTGTTIECNNKLKWVGMPLRVHRRCEKPEFTLSNIISYGGLMIFGTPPRPFLSLSQSQWIDIPQTCGSQDHWIPEEGEATKSLISKLMQEGITPQSIFVISPFRTVVMGLQKKLKTLSKELNIGTIHTTQGKEADVVILVLGGNPVKPGAKKWASQEPNLLNVAVSRAKRRFYIIGNQAKWAQYPYFRDASDLFTVSPNSREEEGIYGGELKRSSRF